MGKEKAKKVSKTDDENFDGVGVDFKCKLIGFTEVCANRGDSICQEAIATLKQVAVKMNKEKNEHKRRITLNFTLRGIRILDELNERIDHAHPIHRISYIYHDKEDRRTFGYIVSSKDGFKLFAIKTPKDAELITKVFKDLFQVVHDRRQARNEIPSARPQEEHHDSYQEENFNKPAVTGLNQIEQGDQQGKLDAFGMDDFAEINEKIETMQEDEMKRSKSSDLLRNSLVRANENSSFPAFDESSSSNLNLLDAYGACSAAFATNHSLGVLLEPPMSEQDSCSSGHLLGFNTPGPALDAPLLMNDSFTELKRNILEIHRQQQHQQQKSYSNPQLNGYASRGLNLSSQSYSYSLNPFSSGVDGDSERETSVVPSWNPFSRMPVTSDDGPGWTVSKRPVPAPKLDVKTSDQSNFDPFAFFDSQLVSQGSASGDLCAQVRKRGDVFGQQSFVSPSTQFDFLG